MLLRHLPLRQIFPRKTSNKTYCLFSPHRHQPLHQHPVQLAASAHQLGEVSSPIPHNSQQALLALTGLVHGVHHLAGLLPRRPPRLTHGMASILSRNPLNPAFSIPQMYGVRLLLLQTANPRIYSGHP